MPTWIACVAHVAVVPEIGEIAVRKLWQTIDVGTVVNPSGAMAQAEGAALWGLSLALREGAEFESGQVKQRNLDTYTPLRMADVPELDIVSSTVTRFPADWVSRPSSLSRLQLATPYSLPPDSGSEIYRSDSSETPPHPFVRKVASA